MSLRVLIGMIMLAVALLPSCGHIDISCTSDGGVDEYECTFSLAACPSFTTAQEFCAAKPEEPK